MGRCADTGDKAQDAEVAWGDVAGGGQMSVSVSSEVFGVCQPVVLRIVLRNVSEKPLPYEETGPEQFRFTVLDEQGNEMPLTRYGTMIQDSRGHSYMRGINRLAPGGEAEWTIVLNRFHDMTVSGIYSVQVRRHVLPGNTRDGELLPLDRKALPEVVSNLVKVRVR